MNNQRDTSHALSCRMKMYAHYMHCWKVMGAANMLTNTPHALKWILLHDFRYTLATRHEYQWSSSYVHASLCTEPLIWWNNHCWGSCSGILLHRLGGILILKSIIIRLYTPFYYWTEPHWDQWQHIVVNHSHAWTRDCRFLLWYMSLRGCWFKLT